MRKFFVLLLVNVKPFVLNCRRKKCGGKVVNANALPANVKLKEQNIKGDYE